MAITTEVDQLGRELERMITGAEFNGVPLLNAATAINLQVGPNASATNTLALTLPNLAVAPAGGQAYTAVITDFKAGTTTTLLSDINLLVDQVSTARGAMGAVQNRLEYTVSALGIYQENLMAAESRIRDVDMAQEMTNFTKLQILQQSGTAMLAQANMSSQSVLSLLQ